MGSEACQACEAVAMSVPVQLMSGKTCILEILPDMTIQEMKQRLKA